MTESSAPATLNATLNGSVVLRLAAPAVANSLLQTLVFVVDRAVLGHYNNNAIAAMQTAGPITWTIWSVFGTFSIGTLAIVGRAIGAKDPQAAARAAKASLLFALVLGLVVALVSTLLAPTMVNAFGSAAGAQVRQTSVAYLQAILPAMPAFFIGMAGISTLQAAGDTRTPLLIGIVTNVVNLIANYALVFGHFGLPALGATGSALGSTIAGVLEASLAMMALSRVGSRVALRAARDSWASIYQSLRAILSVALGSFGERIVYHMGYLWFVRYVTQLGTPSMAANQALIAIESISFLTADGFAVAAGALVAQNMGAGSISNARRAGFLAAGQCAVFLGLCGVVFASFPSVLVRFFVTDPAIVLLAVPVLKLAALAQIPMAVAVVLAQSVRASGATREALVISFIGAFAVRIAATHGFVNFAGLGLLGVWLGSSTDWTVRALVYSYRWWSGKVLRAVNSAAR